MNKQIENSTVLSTIDGIIKGVNRDGGTGENGNQKPLVSITQTSDFRVKGSISEMGSISEGTNVIVRSRINEDQIYKGTVMENHIETNFRAIQRILDSCVAHDYKTKVDALFLKREYLTKAQIKDYLRQEIFRVTENIVAIQQKYRVVRDIVQDLSLIHI